MLRLFTLVVSLLFSCCLSFAQEETLLHYTVNDGLPSSHVYYVMEDSQGYMWFGTDKGLCRFDGYEYETYTIADGLPSNDVWRLMEDSKGRIWLGTYGPDFFYFQNGSIVRVKNPNEAIPRIPIYKMVEDAKGNIWILGNRNVYRFYKDSIRESFDYFVLFEQENLKEHNESEEYLVVGESIYTLKNDSLSFYRSIAFFESHLSKFRNDVSLARYLPLNEFHSLDTSIHFYDNHLYISLKDSLIDLEFPVEHCTDYPRPIKGAQDYVFKCDTSILAIDKELKLTNKYDFLSQFDVHMIYLDQQKNLWIPTNNKGIFMRPSNSVYTKNYTKEGGELAVKSINKSADGAIWIGTMDGEVFRFKDDHLTALPDFLGKEKEALPSVTDIHYSINENKLYFLYKSVFFRCLDLNKPKQNQSYTYDLLGFNKNYRISNSQDIGERARCLKSFGQQESSDTLWIQACNGLLGWSKNGAHYQLKLYDFGRGYALAAKDEQVWLGQTKGLFLFANGELDSLKDLKDRYPILNKNINHLGLDSQNNLWIGTDGYGVFRLRSKEQELDTIAALKNTIVKKLFVDEYDAVWVASNQGLYHIEYLEKENVRLYTSAEGLGSNEVNCAYADSSKIYIGTSNGLTVIERDQKTDSHEPPPLYLQKLLIRGEEQVLSPSKKDYVFDLSYNQNSIKVDYVCLSYKSNQNIVYEYKLSGVEEEWKETKQLTKEYPVLPYGETYTFQLRAKDINQEYSRDVYTLTFNISPPWWETWWFRLLTLSLIVIFIYNRISVFRQKEKEKQAISKKFAELELQALQAQMNPHFVFNALEAIQDFVAGKDERSANKYLSNFAKLMRLFLESSKEKYISLEEDVKLLELYMDLEQLRFEPPFEYEIDCPDSIDWGSVEVPSMLLQPFVENAINHGLKYKKDQGFVKIVIREEGESLLIHIIDNGVGIKKAQEIKQKATKSYKSRGMEITQERLKTIQFVDNVEIVIDVRDRLIKGQVQGTIVEIICPFLEKN